jgi:hypothetical protein
MMQKKAQEIQMRKICYVAFTAGWLALGVSGTNAAPGNAIGGNRQLAVVQSQLVQTIDMRKRRHCTWRNHRRHCWWH